MKKLLSLKKLLLLINLSLTVGTLTNCAENRPSGSKTFHDLSPEEEEKPKVELNEDGEPVVELVPLNTEKWSNPTLERLEEEIRKSRAIIVEEKLASLEDERIDFSNEKITFKHDGDKEVTLDVEYQGVVESITFISPKNHKANFMFEHASGFTERTVTLQGMCIDAPDGCDEIGLQVAYFVNDEKITKHFIRINPNPAKPLEEEPAEIDLTDPEEETEGDEVSVDTTTHLSDQAPEVETNIASGLNKNDTSAEEVSLDIKPHKDGAVEFSPAPTLEDDLNDSTSEIDTKSPTRPDIYNSSLDQMQPPETDILDVPVSEVDSPTVTSDHAQTAPIIPDRDGAFSAPYSPVQPDLDETERDDDLAPSVMSLDPPSLTAPETDQVLGGTGISGEQPYEVNSTALSKPKGEIDRDSTPIVDTSLTTPPDDNKPLDEAPEVTTEIATLGIPFMDDDILEVRIPKSEQNPKLDSEVPSVQNNVDPESSLDIDTTTATPLSKSEEIGVEETKLEEVAVDSTSALAPKTANLRPQARPDDLMDKHPDAEIHSPETFVGGGHLKFPNLDGETGTTEFNINTAESYSLGQETVETSDKLLNTILNASFDQSRKRHNNGFMKNSTQLSAQIVGAKVNPDRRRNHYASGLSTSFLEYISLHFNARYSASPVCVHDISRKNGGTFTHASHKNGLDIDIAYPSSPNFCKEGSTYYFKDWKTLKKSDSNFMKKNWAFIKLMLSTNRVQVIFTDKAFMTAMCTYVKNNTNTPKSERKEIFTKLYHQNKHANHYHIRLECNHQNNGCQDMPQPNRPSKMVTCN